MVLICSFVDKILVILVKILLIAMCLCDKFDLLLTGGRVN